ncbi:hypothetical protein [Neotabrizicola sp. sgz301269]|uniref:hypothetical protein n=1 Tax=Neotabrizicola sp. sgz301269 TaxID=3276282 RepID=UPI00376FF61E
MPDQTVHINCFKWGNLYSADDVNRLHAMFARQLSIPHIFHCVTDDTQGLRDSIRAHPMPDYGFAPRDCGNGKKLAVFMPGFLGLEGQLLLQVDIDVVLIDKVDFLFDHPQNDFMVARGRNQAGNTRGHCAVMRVRVGAMPHLWTDFVADPEGTVARCQHHRGAAGFVSDQRYLDWKLQEMAYFRDGSIVYFRQDCGAYADHPLPQGIAAPPAGASIISFAGQIKPAMVKDGPHGTCRHAPFVAEHWHE